MFFVYPFDRILKRRLINNSLLVGNLRDLAQDVGVHFSVGLHVDKSAGAMEALDKVEKEEADAVN